MYFCSCNLTDYHIMVNSNVQMQFEVQGAATSGIMAGDLPGLLGLLGSLGLLGLLGLRVTGLRGYWAYRGYQGYRGYGVTGFCSSPRPISATTECLQPLIDTKKSGAWMTRHLIFTYLLRSDTFSRFSARFNARSARA